MLSSQSGRESNLYLAETATSKHLTKVTESCSSHLNLELTHEIR
jgi:hypothetical protein